MENYQQTVADWRARLQENERKTKYVIGIFISLYVLVGGLADTFLITQRYHVDLQTAVKGLISLQIVPYATIIMAVVALISLWVTYLFYDKLMLLGTQAQQITPSHCPDEQSQRLYNVVEEMKIAAGLNYMPKVFIIEADYMNAFASGYSEKSAMVAITRGLINKLNRDELQAVMAHELSHIRHHDIKLTLTVAVLSNLTLMVIDALFYSVLFSNNRRDRNNKQQNGTAILFLIIMLLRYLLPVITILLSLFLSRTREYMADAGAVALMRDNGPLASALMKITYDHRENAELYRHAYGKTSHEDVRRAAYIYDPGRIDPVKSLTSAFSTHPTLEQRLKAIGFIQRSK